jgi:hypothetical protein
VRRLVHTFWLLLAGCVVSPQPSPPSITIESSTLSTVDYADGYIDGVMVIGPAGAIDPAAGVVVGTSLDNTTAPSAEPVMPDGSFRLLIFDGDGPTGGEYRIQARNGSERSAAFDFFANDGIDPAPRPHLDCLLLEPAYEIDFGVLAPGASAEASVVVNNLCDVELTIAAPRFRESDAPFSSEAEQIILAPGGATEIVVRASSEELGSHEATLFVQEIAPMRDRRPLTLFLRVDE